MARHSGYSVSVISPTRGIQGRMKLFSLQSSAQGLQRTDRSTRGDANWSLPETTGLGIGNTLPCTASLTNFTSKQIYSMTGSSDAILTFLSLKEKLWPFLQYIRQFHGKCWFPSQAMLGRSGRSRTYSLAEYGTTVMDLYAVTVNKTAMKDTVSHRVFLGPRD